MKDDIKEWLEKDGERFLKGIGIKRGQIVLDFGCKEGHYTIPAAKVVGEKGKVYAVDKDKQVLNRLMEIAGETGLENIKVIETKGELEISGISKDSIDVTLLYDVIHLVPDRIALYKEIYRVLKPDGLLSVYPKHYSSDQPGWGLEGMDLEDIIKEIEKTGFILKKKIFGRLLHDDTYNEGYVLNCFKF